MRLFSRHFIAVLGLIALAACAPQSKYPFTAQYASPEQVPARLLEVPPQPHSSKWETAIQDIVTRQAHVTDAEIKKIREEMPVKPEMMVQAIWGEAVTRQTHPVLYEFLRKTGSDAWRIGDHAKSYWGTTRPWLADARVKRFIDPIYSHAYPSGHTTSSHVWAAVLSELAPHAHKALFARADDVAQHRIVAGAHYMHDVAAGKRLARLITQRFKRAAQYEADIQAVRAELAKNPLPEIVYHTQNTHHKDRACTHTRSHKPSGKVQLGR